MSVRAAGQVLAVTAALVHGALAVAEPSAVALAMLPLALGCVLCARHLERARAWVGCGVLDAAMLALMVLDHAAAAAGPVAAVAVVGHHGEHAASLLPGAARSDGAAHGLMVVAEGLVVAQLALAVVVLALLAVRHRGGAQWRHGPARPAARTPVNAPAFERPTVVR
ncbi:MAG: hypothetical protein PGN11_10620 [Quadrisphaera sp.]